MKKGSFIDLVPLWRGAVLWCAIIKIFRARLFRFCSVIFCARLTHVAGLFFESLEMAQEKLEPPNLKHLTSPAYNRLSDKQRQVSIMH